MVIDAYDPSIHEAERKGSQTSNYGFTQLVYPFLMWVDLVSINKDIIYICI